jgi:hypothetical protein
MDVDALCRLPHRAPTSTDCTTRFGGKLMGRRGVPGRPSSQEGPICPGVQAPMPGHDHATRPW